MTKHNNLTLSFSCVSLPNTYPSNSDIKVPTGSFNTANLDTTYMTFTYAPLARTQLHDETVFLCIQEEKKRNSVQNQPVSATNHVCVGMCAMLLCVPVIYLECNELKQYFIIFLSWFYGLTRFTQQGIICFGSLLQLKSDVGQGFGPLKIQLDWVSKIAPQMACSSCWPSPGNRQQSKQANSCTFW